MLKRIILCLIAIALLVPVVPAEEQFPLPDNAVEAILEPAAVVNVDDELPPTEAAELPLDIDALLPEPSAAAEMSGIMLEDASDPAEETETETATEVVGDPLDVFESANTPAQAASGSQSVVELTLSGDDQKTVSIGTTYQLLVPDGAIATCTSSQASIAAVTASGTLTPRKPGNATITIVLEDERTLSLALTIKDPAVPVKVTIRQGSSRILKKGKQLRLTAVVTPATAPQAVKWKSSNKAVAKVSSAGLVKALKPGRAFITASTSNGKTARFIVIVRTHITKPFLISHAMGGIDGKAYSNCLEAFEQNYAEGHRIFEVDFSYTSDGKLVLWHSWNNQICSAHKPGYKPTYKQFMSAKIFDRYTPMSVADLLKLMKQYPDIRIITDTRLSSPTKARRQFATIVSTAKKLGLKRVLGQFIVEVYSEDMFRAVRKIYPFKSYLYTLYRKFKKAPSSAQLKQVAAFCARNGIDMIGMFVEWWKPSYINVLARYDIDISLYSNNRSSDVARFLSQGVTAVFTDFLPPL